VPGDWTILSGHEKRNAREHKHVETDTGNRFSGKHLWCAPAAIRIGDMRTP